MSRALRSRIAIIEAGQFVDALIIVNPRRFPGQPMTEPELAPDPLALLLGEDEAEAINRSTRKVAIKRSYWGHA